MIYSNTLTGFRILELEVITQPNESGHFCASGFD